MAIEFDIRDPKNQKIIATFMIPVVILAAFYQFMIKPMVEDLAVKQAELNTVRQQVTRIMSGLKTVEQLQGEKDALTAKLAELESLLPTEENVALLLSRFAMVERDANVYLVGFDAAETVDDGEKPYRANNYRMTIEAGYHQFADFITKVMSLPRLMSFSDLRITMNPLITEETESYEGMENQPRHLKIECMLTTYIFKGFQEEQSTQ